MKVGNFVRWMQCPPHLSKFDRGQIQEVQGDRARLTWFETWVQISELELVDPTEIERHRCNGYGKPIIEEF